MPTKPARGETKIEEASIKDRAGSTATTGEREVVEKIAASKTTTGAIGIGTVATAVIGTATVGIGIPKTAASSKSSHQEA